METDVEDIYFSRRSSHDPELGETEEAVAGEHLPVDRMSEGLADANITKHFALEVEITPWHS
jgi:hypothetical protein